MSRASQTYITASRHHRFSHWQLILGIVAFLSLVLGRGQPTWAGSSFKVGNFTKITSTGNQVVSHNLGVTPKALILWTVRKSNDAFGESYHSALGFSDGTTQKAGAASSANSFPGSLAGQRLANKAITIIGEGHSMLSAEADLTSWDATTLTLDWTTNRSGADVIITSLSGGRMSRRKCWVGKCAHQRATSL